jgi:hypothetical protein
MDTSSKLFRTSAAVLAAGGLLWVVKFVVIAATDGAVSGLPDTVTAVLYLSAVLLMAIGSGGLAVALLARRHLALRVVGALAAVVAWWIVYVVVDGVTKSAAGDAGPVWLPDEIGIVVTGALLMAVGLLLVRSTSDARHQDSARV